MTKDELQEALAMVRANWNLRLTPQQERDQVRTWGRYLKDLEYPHVKKAIDRMVLRNGPPPRVGEVRRRAIDIGDPDGAISGPEATWFEVQRLRGSMESGLPWIEASPVIQRMLDRGYDVLGMYTNGDREVFFRLYDEVLLEIGAERYGIDD